MLHIVSKEKRVCSHGSRGETLPGAYTGGASRGLGAGPGSALSPSTWRRLRKASIWRCCHSCFAALITSRSLSRSASYACQIPNFTPAFLQNSHHKTRVRLAGLNKGKKIKCKKYAKKICMLQPVALNVPAVNQTKSDCGKAYCNTAIAR